MIPTSQASQPPEQASPPAHPPGAHDPYAALRVRDFRLFLGGNVLAMMGMQMQTAAVGWEIYNRTGQPIDVGWIGLVQFLPVIALTLPAGQLADRFSRKWIVMAAMLSMAICSLALAWVSAQRGELWIMYVILFLTGVARAFQQPAKASLLPQIVPRQRFSSAVTWNTGAFQVAAVIGPAVAGFVIWAFSGAAVVYLLDAASTLTFALFLGRIASPPVVRSAGAATWETLVAGLGYVWRAKVMLAAITLDMFAVLLGGAVALLPVFAKDILHVGAQGFGWMRAAPAVGALVMMVVLTHRRPLERAGQALLWSVVGFGAAIIVFGLSRSFWLSLAMLFLTGAFDLISVVVRHTLVQMLTPDEMRGRVSAVNSMFIGASNELGGFESGLVAQLFNPTVSVVSGGVGTLAVVAVVAATWPQLRRHGKLD